ncbi:MAG: hypothetical protein ACI857_002243 [Arenicella sp.]|jgi:hypothetical protein
MKYLYFSFLLAIASHSNFAQTTLIPDVNFEQALIDQGYDTGPANGSVFTDSINTLTNVNLNGKSISDLSGIEDFTAVDILDCSNNQLSALDVSNNLLLHGLVCFSNQLTTLDLSNNTDLIGFDCSYNQITSLDLSTNINLTSIVCAGNDIPSLDISSLPELAYIDCAFNNLTSIDFSQAPFLIHVEISSNNIPTLDFSNNPDLNLLYCDSNGLTDINVSQNTKLRYLNCVVNDITSLDVTNCDSLRYLYFTDNQLTQIDVSQNPNLRDFFCEGNQIEMLNFENNIMLNWIVCNDNKLKCLKAKNGFNNDMFGIVSFNNPNLNCIEVDDPMYAALNWQNVASNAIYSGDCGESCIMGFEKKEELSISIYPNPVTNGILNIENQSDYLDFTIYNSIGQVLQSGRTLNQIDGSNLANGSYLLELRISEKFQIQKFVIH